MLTAFITQIQTGDIPTTKLTTEPWTSMMNKRHLLVGVRQGHRSNWL